jgi:predicted PurR-regulated permease PerM
MKKNNIAWLSLLAILGVFLYGVSSILLPFVVGIIIAYFLRPAADRFEKIGIPKGLSSALIILGFLAFIFIFSITILPVLYDQLIGLIKHTPEYIKYFDIKLKPLIASLNQMVGVELISNNSNLLLEHVSQYTLKISGLLVSNIWHSGLAVVSVISLIFITPMVAFYLLRDWHVITAKLLSIVPKKNLAVVKEQIGLIDNTLSAYIRGQTNVCLLLGITYALALNFLGLNFGFLIGFLTGILCFIPYVGVAIGMFIGMGVAVFQFNSTNEILAVLAVFVVGQVIEGTFVTPKLVGDKVGIHPVWIIFALLAGASMFGFLGVLFAIPVTATIGILTRLIVKTYRKSNYYTIK